MKIRNVRYWAPRNTSRWIYVVLALLAACIVSWLAQVALGADMPEPAFCLAAALIEYFLGLGPAFATMSIGMLLADLLFVRPYGHPLIQDGDDAFLMASFLLITPLVILLMERLRRAQYRAQLHGAVSQSRYEMLLRHDNERALLARGMTPDAEATGRHAILLLHGLSSSPLELRNLSRHLQDAGFHVHAPVLPGYSAGSPELPMERWIDAALAEFDTLTGSYDTVSLCGLSMGATLALHIARARPATRALALLSVTLAYDGWSMPWYRFLLGYAYYTPLRRRYQQKEREPFGLRNEALRARVIRTMQRNALSEVGPSTLSLFMLHQAQRLIRRVRKEIAAIRCDTLVIHAIDDETAGPRSALHVAKHSRATMKRIIWLDDSYHMITVDNEREIVARETALFLRDSVSHDDTGAQVVSKALARRLRQTSAAGKAAPGKSAS